MRQEIDSQDVWQVVSSFFSENGLVSQQNNSFNHFLTNAIQDTVEEVGKITIKPERQYRPGDVARRTSGKFFY